MTTTSESLPSVSVSPELREQGASLERAAAALGGRAAESTRRRAHPRLLAGAEVLFAGYVAIAGTLVLLGLLLTKVLLSGPLGDADDSATRWLSEHRGSAADTVTNILSRSADTLGAIGIAVLVAAVLAIGRHWRYIAALALGLALELSVFLAVNFIVDRPRPDVAKLGSEPATSSFPSGHSAATTVIYVLVALCVSSTLRRRGPRIAAWCVAILMPCAVGFARVYRGMHHPIDVLFGILMGVAALMISLATVEAVRANTSRVAPARDDVDTVDTVTEVAA